MRIHALPSALLAFAALLVAGAAPRADDPASLVLAQASVDRCRGKEHREKMRVTWPAVADETPPDGAEVVLVRGYMSYEMTRMVLRGGKVEAGSIAAARSWFYNQTRGESFAASAFDVDAEAFVRAWNAMRRVLAASDERIEPEPEEHELGRSFMIGSHESADWIRARVAVEGPPVHCAGRGSRSYDWDDVREWSGLRDQAVFELFEALLPARDAAAPRSMPVATWSAFAAAQVRDCANAPDRERVDRDHEFIDTCLRVLGVAGDEASESDVAALDTSLAGLGDPGYWVESVRDEILRAATRLRVRHHWDREDVVRTLRSAPDGTWAREDQARWLRRTFREKDPAGWAAFLVDEATRDGARPEDVAAAAAELKDLPAADAVPVLRNLLARADAYVRLESALALHAIDPTDEAAKSAVVALALDRSIACNWRPDLTNRWSRNRALDAALDWGELATVDLHAHVVAPEPEDPEFLRSAERRLAGTPDALTDAETRDAWRRLLDSPQPGRLLAAVACLLELEDVVSMERMLAALGRLDARVAEVGEDEADARAADVADWIERVRRLGEPKPEPEPTDAVK